MIVKGIISAIYADEKKLSVILPEYDNVTTNPLEVYGDADMTNFKIKEFVIVGMFNNEFGDGIVLSSSSGTVNVSSITNIELEAMLK